MQINIENFRGITTASLTVAPLALLAGHNGAGKSSIALAVAAAASKTPVPYAGMTKSACGAMVRHGSKKGSVTISGGMGSTTVEWKAKGGADVLSNGEGPTASPVAVGLVDVLALNQKEMLALMMATLKAGVTKADLLAEVLQRGLDAAVADKVWAGIEKNGWDASEKQARETGARLKGQWQEVTGETWGTDKGALWVPAEHWDATMLTIKPEALATALTKAQSNLDGVAVTTGVNEALRAQYQAHAAKVPALTDALAAADVAVKTAADALAAVDKELAQTPNPTGTKKTYECPHCSKPVAIVQPTSIGGEVALAVADKPLLDGEALRLAHSVYATLCGKQQQAKTTHVLAIKEAANARARLDAAEDAAANLGSMPPAEANTNSGGEAHAAREAVDAARAKLTAKENHTRAHVLHNQIADNLAIIEMVGEQGVRKTKLVQTLDSFANGYLHPTSATLGIAPVTVTAEMQVVCGVTPLRMLSRSEQYRVRACLQLCMARIDGSELVVLDDAEVLVSGPHRGALIAAVLEAGVPAVVCMAYKNQEGLPDLAATGQGATYWVTGNTATPYGALAQQAAA